LQIPEMLNLHCSICIFQFFPPTRCGSGPLVLFLLLGLAPVLWAQPANPNDEAGGKLDPQDKQWFLANVDADPGERANLARLHPDIFKRLRKLEPASASQSSRSREIKGASKEALLTCQEPRGRWEAQYRRAAGTLSIRFSNGTDELVWAQGPAIGEVSWAPDGSNLLVVKGREHNELREAALWRTSVSPGRVGAPVELFSGRSPAARNAPSGIEIIQLGKWSPDGRRVTFWTGPNSASVAADGLPLWVVEVGTGHASMIQAAWPLGMRAAAGEEQMIRSGEGAGPPWLAEVVLVNLRYQSWAPDSSRLAVTAGGDRSAQTHKWLLIYDTTTGRSRTVVGEDQQIPGIVNWSPNGDWLAYAASSPQAADDGSMTFANPAISNRRVYLLNLQTGQHRRLNRVESYQDAPCWGERRDELFYVERHRDRVALMVTNIATGIAKTLTEVETPSSVGYYGQADWDDLLQKRGAAR
jgi:hypothetical protein